MFTDEAVCDRLYTRITTEKLGNEPLQQGYLGVLTMAKGTHKINPFSRLGTFNDGRDILEAAIVTAPNSVELRFLRFAIQVNVPSILGYGEERKTDKSFIEARLHEVHDETMRKRNDRVHCTGRCPGKSLAILFALMKKPVSATVW
ncbi:MAG: hypothetical protein IPG74_16275 [Flavobacteriales bacterium]|nr:hypothetical protein [Flavobacteriales bacterium]